MKNIIIIILYFFIITSSINAQESHYDTIIWKVGYKLKWDDFKGVPDSRSENAAMTYSGINYSYHFTDSRFFFDVYTFFDSRHSWKKSPINNYILSHEQVHFDITEIYSRKLRKVLSELIPNCRTINTEIFLIVKKMNEEKEEMQDKYDTETDFSNNSKKQEYWSEKVKNELQKLDKYK